MKKLKIPAFALFVVLCLGLNMGGKQLAAAWNLPMWLDNLGTALCAYTAGPVVASIMGLTGNLLYMIMYNDYAIYGAVTVILAVVIGYGCKKKMMDTIYTTLILSAWTMLAALVGSFPLNLLLYEGTTGNEWGDGVILWLQEQGLPPFLSAMMGQYYIEFFDKFVTLMFLFFVVRTVRWLRRKMEKTKPDVKAALSILLLTVLSLSSMLPAVRAEENKDTREAVVYNNYVQTTYSSRNGLPCGEANDIAQTNDGILWIGTYAGLYRYNGTEFHWMNNYDRVRNVNCLYVDEEGRLWIGTNDNGLVICINEKISNVIDSDNGLPSNSVRSIIQSADGYYYVGTTDRMQILALNNGLQIVKTLPEVYYADDITADDQGRVAAVTNSGTLFLLQGGEILYSFTLPDPSEQFTACFFDPVTDRLMAGTSKDHIYLYEVGEEAAREVGVIPCEGLRNLKAMYRLESGELFISSDIGVGYLDFQEQFHYVNTNAFNASIDRILQDYQGNIWFTSSRLGLLRMTESSFRDVYRTIGMNSQVVNAITFWQDTYYIGTDKGLDAVDATCRVQVQNELTEQFKGVRIRCLLNDSRGHMWLCTYGSGLVEVLPDGTQYLYNQQNGSFGNRARLVFELSDGTIMAGGDTGISYIRDHQILRTIGFEDGLINSMILSFVEMPDGRILAGTDGDGIAVLVDGKVQRMITRHDGLSSEVLLRMVKDPGGDGVLLVTSNGLCYMNADETVRPLEHFPYFNNYDIVACGNNELFVLSSAGLYVADRDELVADKEGYTCDVLDSRRGLNSALTANSWTYMTADGDLFLPCGNGVQIIDTQRYNADVPYCRMMIPSIRLDQELISTERATTFVIDRGVSKVELLPEIINFTIQNPYVGYYLEGFDTNWTILPEASVNSIVYTNLEPGEYQFRLALFDNSSQHVLAERSYKLIKDYALYDTRKFFVYLCMIPLLTMAALSYFLSYRVAAKRKKELADAMQQLKMADETIVAIAKAVDSKDERTSLHSERVSIYSAMIGREYGLPESECENLRKAALMHDIGKIGIPDAILNKPARLTDEEYAVMKSHTVHGSEILSGFTLIDHVAEGAKFHHERYDGRGYPHGLKGEEIPLYARIIGVADAFDAMTANRVYRKQLDIGFVYEEIKKGRGTQFDPQMADILLKLIDDGKIDIKKLYPVDNGAEEAEKKDAPAPAPAG